MPLHHFLIPLCPKTDVGRGRLKMVVLSGNGRQNHKFGSAGNTCGRKSKGDEKQLEWPYISYISSLTLFTIYSGP